jgi:hypothetical protein
MQSHSGDNAAHDNIINDTTAEDLLLRLFVRKCCVDTARQQRCQEQRSSKS